MTKSQNWSRKWLDYEFSAPELLETALTHKSKSAINNERLEFLGDAVLGMVVGEALFQARPDSDEGGLSRHRAALVRRETLAELAGEVRLGDILRLGGGELRSGGSQRQSILADGLEALFGAVYLDGGFGSARDVILKLYADRLANLPDSDELKDPKTRLQEALQSAGIPVPVYVVETEEGPAHARHYEVQCVVKDLDVRTTGAGSSRRKAEQAAAAAALELVNDRRDRTP